MIKITGEINNLRLKIDKIDKDIISLILERMNLVKNVGNIKNIDNSRVYVPEREALIFKNLSNFSSLSPKEIQSIYTEIISSCRRLENTISVAVLKNSSSLFALKKIFGEYVNPIYFSNFQKFISIDSNIKYMLISFSKDMIEAIKENNWFIINSVTIDNEKYFLLSKFPNTISIEGEMSFFLSNDYLNSYSIQIKENLFFTAIEGFFNNENKMKTLSNSYPNVFIQLVGSTVEI